MHVPLIPSCPKELQLSERELAGGPKDLRAKTWQRFSLVITNQNKFLLEWFHWYEEAKLLVCICSHQYQENQTFRGLNKSVATVVFRSRKARWDISSAKAKPNSVAA